MADAARKRPDPRPMRLAYAVGALGALSAVAAGLVHVSATAPVQVELAPQDPPATPRNVEVQHVIQYIHLKPGETAPPGATVITPDAPAPRVVITHVQAPAPQQPPRRIVITRPSGRP